MANLETAPVTLGIYLRSLISRALHLSPKALDVSFSFALTTDSKIAAFQSLSVSCNEIDIVRMKKSLVQHWYLPLLIFFGMYTGEGDLRRISLPSSNMLLWLSINKQVHTRTKKKQVFKKAEKEETLHQTADNVI